jgi:hypothetical protein
MRKNKKIAASTRWEHYLVISSKLESLWVIFPTWVAGILISCYFSTIKNKLFTSVGEWASETQAMVITLAWVCALCSKSPEVSEALGLAHVTLTAQKWVLSKTEQPWPQAPLARLWSAYCLALIYSSPLPPRSYPQERSGQAHLLESILMRATFCHSR